LFVKIFKSKTLGSVKGKPLYANRENVGKPRIRPLWGRSAIDIPYPALHAGLITLIRHPADQDNASGNGIGVDSIQTIKK
jgi:hypothetical protein